MHKLHARSTADAENNAVRVILLIRDASGLGSTVMRFVNLVQPLTMVCMAAANSTALRTSTAAAAALHTRPRSYLFPPPLTCACTAVSLSPHGASEFLIV